MIHRVLLFFLCFGTFAQAAKTEKTKNVVFILADDLGWSDTTLYGTTRFYETPNLERLAKRGMTFDRAYAASPLCSPTRSAILTGLSPARTGLTVPNCHLPQVVLNASIGTKAAANQRAIQPNSVTRLATDYRTLAETLKGEGYATGHFGKWHLGSDPYSSLQQGFDVDLPHTAGPGPAGSYVAPWKFKDFDADPDVPNQHIEDRMAKEAVAFLKAHQKESFFLNYWMFSVHAPFDAKADLIEKHRRRVDPNDPQRSPTYAAMIESMDDAVGTILDTLDELGLMEQTIVIFTSDNGGNMYNEVDGTTPTSNAPLKGGKATMYEGGTRVPCVIVWPDLTAPGSRSSELIQSEDFYPTLLAGLAIPAASGQVFDGVDIRNAFTGGTLKRPAVFQYFPHSPPVPDWLPPSVSVHSGDFKLIRLFYGGENVAHRFLLYDLKADIGETANLAAENPDLVEDLDAMIENFLSETGAIRPVANPAFDPAFYRPELEGTAVPKKSKTSDTPASVWQGSPKARIEKKGEVTILSSEGNDPWMSTSRVPSGAKGPFRVELRFQSPSKGPAMFYFRATAKDRFEKGNTVSFPTNGDDEMHDYELDLPCKTLHSLRLDPAPGAGEFRFEAIRLIDAAGKMTSLFP